MSAALPVGHPAAHLRSELADGVLTLTLNRPRVSNAMSRAMLDALASALDDAERSDEVTVVVLAAAGRAFCAGGDVTLLRRGESIFGPGDAPAERLRVQTASQRATVVRLHEFAKPTIAAVQGAAVGAGLALALACDLRYAATSARLQTGFARIGLAGDFGCTWLLRELVGPSRAKQLLFLGDPVPAEQAAALGLVNEVVADGELDSAVWAAARRIAAVPEAALRTMKGHVERAGRSDLPTCADIEVREHVRLLQTPEHRALVDALVADRRTR